MFLEPFKGIDVTASHQERFQLCQVRLNRHTLCTVFYRLLYFLQIEDKNIHQQQDYNLLHCSSLEPNI